MRQSPRIITTQDGSPTCIHPVHGASYRSTHGAINEVRHVFIDSTLSHLPTDATDISVLEFGFGLGTSFGETLLFAREKGVFLNYLAVEREPVPPDFAQHPNTDVRNIAAQLLDQLHRHPTDTPFFATLQGEDFRVQVFLGDFLQLSTPFSADAIFFDPFGPSENPESWDTTIFDVAKAHMKPHARLATYSAAGKVRRAMAAAQLVLATRPGPAGKREITVAALTHDALQVPPDDLSLLRMTRYLPK